MAALAFSIFSGSICSESSARQIALARIGAGGGQAARDRHRRSFAAVTRCTSAPSSNAGATAQITPVPYIVALLSAAQPGGGNDGDGSDGPVASAAAILGGGTAVHAAMTVAGAALGDTRGLAVTSQLLGGQGGALSLLDALLYMVPLGGMCWAGVALSGRVEEFARLKHLFQQQLIPQLQTLPLWGLGLLALGAGVGEETLFRGFLQSAAIDFLQGGPLPEAAATAAGLAGTAVIFGALHALTPSYFWFATAAGVLFGVEYLACGLQTAAATHWLYDWAALVYIIQTWGSSSSGGGGGSTAPEAAQGAKLES